ncbi:WD repeat-containing protein 36 isoform X1 [Lingula anatina]|uniref:WD repeat-containing protein 36 isoform X1 n=1 Tax=Lingula anatina TaxID=7574 RepID=A0A1S3H174_LINAN|nr:WD repeat-containing protein 36 isoform X1 [Lingula anatina]|eukprot:XP_013379758.1 WD repeat-containing protein 36 isoform X1 [Lingula anatina]
MGSPSRIFCGYRALGFNSNHVPLAVRYHQKHKENYVVTCVGKAFHTYNCSKLGIVSVSNSHPDDINCLAVDAYLVFTGCKNVIRAFTRGREVSHTYEGHESNVILLLPFGNHLISVDEDSYVNIWDIQSEELYSSLGFEKEVFAITAAFHPSTYLNKILLGSKQGALQLWNIKTGKLIYSFTGWKQAVTVLEQAPAVDVAAIGLADGQVILHNLKYDETLMKFMQDWGPVTTVAFRTDGSPVMATGSVAGHIALWNLEEKRLLSQMRGAHSGSVTGMKCLPSEPLMVTSSADNSLKVWIFDQPDGGGRLLRQRTGHSAPPSKVRFHGNNGQNILSAGQDSTLRSFSTVHDRHNKSLGRASYNKAETKKTGLKLDQHMMPPITDFDSEISRQSDWDNILACHRGLGEVTTWNYQRSSMGKHRLAHQRLTSKEHGGTVALCVCLTSCGNFGLIGYSSGHVDVYNMQSGLHRGSYGNPTAHDGAVRGVAVDGLNQVTVTAGADFTIKFWKFKQKQLLETLKVEAQVASILLHRESCMLAAACDDFSISIIDIETRKVVRRFEGHTNRVNDMVRVTKQTATNTFSPDSRWLVTASMDALVRTWDLPTGRLLDCFALDAAATSLTMSPTGDFLATTHVDDLGIYLWSNKTLYTHVPLRPLPSDFEPVTMEMPSTSRKSQGAPEEREEDVEYVTSDFKSPAQISDELVTLSLLPNSRWQNLLHLDIIKQRNKPKEPPKVPKSAPFFLPTVPGLEFKFAPADEGIVANKEGSHISKLTETQNLTEFGKLLKMSASNGNTSEVLSKLKELSPAAIDVELRGLAPEAGGSVALMVQFLKFISDVLDSKKDFELAQAYLGLFLKLHGELIANDQQLLEQAQLLGNSQAQAWKHLQTMFNQSLCLVNYLKSATL